MRKLCIYMFSVQGSAYKEFGFPGMGDISSLLPLPRAKSPRAARFIAIFVWAQTFRHLHERFGLFPFAFGAQGMEIPSSASRQDGVLPHG